MKKREVLTAIEKLLNAPLLQRCDQFLKSTAPSVRKRLRDHWHRQTSLRNVFQDREGSRPRAALSYLSRAFLESENSEPFFNHSNMWECLEIARILRRLGFIVDAFDALAAVPGPPPGDYSLFFDLGPRLEAVSAYLRPDCVKICYATGRHWLVNNAAEYDRLEGLRRRRGFVLLPRRTAQPVSSYESADAVFALGNSAALQSFSHLRQPLYAIRASVPAALFSNAPRDWSTAKKSFIWLGSGGMVHKGLDLVLEAFSRLPQLQLHVVGPVTEERDFVQAYKQELFDTPNIHTHGFLNAAGNEFESIAQACGALVYPSSSEGVSGAVLACAAKGLVPLVSKVSALESGAGEVVLSECSVESLIDEVLKVEAFPEAEFEERSLFVRRYVSANHSRECFSNSMEIALNRASRRFAAHHG